MSTASNGWNRAPYDKQDLARMQADAIHRVKVMRDHANGMVAQTNQSGQTAPLRMPDPMPQPIPPPPDRRQDPVPTMPMPALAHHKEKESSHSGEEKKGVWASVTSLFDTLGLEQDHLILLILLFLLITSEESDRTLLLALFYLLL